MTRPKTWAALLLLLPAASSYGLCQEVLWEQTGGGASMFGESLGASNDLNADGVPDLLVGAWTDANLAGKAFVLSGSDGAVVLEVVGPVPSGTLGWGVVDAGDTNSDGVRDFLAGSTNLGEARLFSGANGALLQALPAFSYARVAAPGDVNGDGVPDLLVGAPSYNFDSGQAWVFSGSNGSVIHAIAGPVGCGLFGRGVEAVTDLDGDGVKELLIGAPVHGLCSNLPGSAYVYSGATGSLLLTLQGPQSSGDRFGSTVADLGDVTGDGIHDVAVGAWGMLPRQVRVYSGGNGSLLAVVTGSAPTNENFGKFDVSGPGDVDGDGFPDLFVGAQDAPPLIPNFGSAGRAVLCSGADWSELYSLTPPAGEYLNMGWAVEGLPDVDGDDFPDLAVGAPGLPGAPTFPNTAGKVRLISGAPTGVEVFGTSCTGPSGKTPRVGATRPAALGSTMTVNLSKAAPGAPCLLILGFSSNAWGPLTLPFPLASLGLPGCSLLVSLDLALPLTTSAYTPGFGRAIVPLSIPAIPSLAGFQFYAQWYVAEAAPAPAPASMTRALEITIQP